MLSDPSIGMHFPETRMDVETFPGATADLFAAFEEPIQKIAMIPTAVYTDSDKKSQDRSKLSSSADLS